jgi:hypothetical protein
MQPTNTNQLPGEQPLAGHADCIAFHFIPLKILIMYLFVNEIMPHPSTNHCSSPSPPPCASSGKIQEN